MSSREVRDAVGEAAPRLKAITAVEQLARKHEELAEAEAALSRAEATMDVDAVVAARQRVVVLRGFIATLEPKAAEEREATAKQQAEKRAVGISRAAGSIAASIEADENTVVAAADAYTATVEQLNRRYRQFTALVAEDAALRDRFGIKGAKIPHVAAPNDRERVVTAVRATQAVPFATYAPHRPALESDEYQLRQRRTYEEVAGTEGYSLIREAGLKPFRALTERERQAVEELGREREANVGALQGLAVEATIAQAVPWTGGGTVARG